MNFLTGRLTGPFLCMFLVLTTAFSRPTFGEPSPEKTGMVLIPAGSYVMGSKRSLLELEPWDIFNTDRHMLGPEDPAHEVYVDSFYIDIYEVTNKAYGTYLASTGSPEPGFWSDPEFNAPDQPVVGLTWKQAHQYCQRQHKRLPTEAEWEKAARGKRPVNFPWGDEEPDNQRLNFNMTLGKSSAVGSYESGKSDYGVYDLSGNVSEWVHDWHDPEYYLFSPKKNPKGPDKGQYKVIRGGNWRSNGDDVRLTYRNATVPRLKNNTVGFRCAADAAAEDSGEDTSKKPGSNKP